MDVLARKGEGGLCDDAERAGSTVRTHGATGAGGKTTPLPQHHARRNVRPLPSLRVLNIAWMRFHDAAPYIVD